MCTVEADEAERKGGSRSASHFSEVGGWCRPGTSGKDLQHITFYRPGGTKAFETSYAVRVQFSSAALRSSAVALSAAASRAMAAPPAGSTCGSRRSSAAINSRSPHTGATVVTLEVRGGSSTDAAVPLCTPTPAARDVGSQVEFSRTEPASVRAVRLSRCLVRADRPTLALDRSARETPSILRPRRQYRFDTRRRRQERHGMY